MGTLGFLNTKMADTTYNLAESQLENGTIDFYTLLGESPDADAETLRAKIGALYNYASANRDHRNLNKRREFQALLELLPPARTALLEEPKRARYDAYLVAARAGQADTDFETFMNDLLGNTEADADKTSLLGVQDKRSAPTSPSVEPKARVIKAPAPPVASRPSPPQSSGNPMLPIFGAVGGFVLGFVLGYVLLHGIVPALLIGAILAAIGFVVLNKKPGGRIGT